VPVVRVLHVGLGPIGVAIAGQIATRPGVRSVAAIDIDPSKVGRDLGEVAGLDRRLGVSVRDNLHHAVRKARPHIAVVCTSSSLQGVMADLEILLAFRIPVVSTTEELAYPWRAHPRQARRIDSLARKAGVAVLATGVNPGFVMDALPIALTAACEHVERITVHRVQDAGMRRLPFQHKVGVGLTPAAFARHVTEGAVRHIGFRQSIAMIADACGWRLDRVTDEVAPRLATQIIQGEHLSVAPGQVCGIVQEAVGYRSGEPVIRLHLEAYLGAPQTYDSIEIEGIPRLAMRLAGGLHGDVVTASIVVNSIPHVLAAAPGLRTMRDLALPSYFPGRWR
jgi:4-hydroxy-tetrahydrodipicolinate reductase